MKRMIQLWIAALMVVFAVSTKGQDAPSCEFNCGTFFTLQEIPVACSAPSICLFNGKVYLTGGYTGVNPDDNSFLFDVTFNVYDPVNDSWDVGRSPLPFARDCNAAMVEGKWYFPGGLSFEHRKNDYPIPTPHDRLDIYDSQTDTWEMKTGIPEAIGGAAVAAIDGKIYVAGGYDADKEVVGSLYIYDPQSDTWSTAKEMITPRALHGYAVVDGKLYCFGGKPDYELFTGVGTAEVYDPASDTWTEISYPEYGGYTTGNGITAVDQNIYTFGSNVNNDIYKYNPKSDSWIKIGEKPSSLVGISRIRAIAVERTIYLLGGENPQSHIPNQGITALELSAIDLEAAIPSQEIAGEPVQIDLSEYFSHVEEEPITYTVCNTDPKTVEASIEGEILTLTSLKKWFTNISVLAESGSDQMGYTFGVNIINSDPVNDQDYSNLWVFPNPTTGMVSLTYSLDSPQDISLEIIDITGRQTATLTKGRQVAGSHQMDWDTEEVVPGMYFCVLHTPHTHMAVKLIVK